MTLHLHLQIVGVLLILLGALNVLLPRYFGWKRDLAALPLFTRRVFWVHCFFIILILEIFGVGTLLCAGALLEPGPLSRAVLAGMDLFWGCRLLFQFFVFESELWRGNALFTRIHYAMALLWTYFVSTYTAALWSVWS
jgi:hypothetical protein